MPARASAVTLPREDGPPFVGVAVEVLPLENPLEILNSDRTPMTPLQLVEMNGFVSISDGIEAAYAAGAKWSAGCSRSGGLEVLERWGIAFFTGKLPLTDEAAARWADAVMEQGKLMVIAGYRVSVDATTGAAQFDPAASSWLFTPFFIDPTT